MNTGNKANNSNTRKHLKQIYYCPPGLLISARDGKYNGAAMQKTCFDSQLKRYIDQVLVVNGPNSEINLEKITGGEQPHYSHVTLRDRKKLHHTGGTGSIGFTF